MWASPPLRHALAGASVPACTVAAEVGEHRKQRMQSAAVGAPNQGAVTELLAHLIIEVGIEGSPLTATLTDCSGCDQPLTGTRRSSNTAPTSLVTVVRALSGIRLSRVSAP